jgi:hypothetical protein
MAALTLTNCIEKLKQKAVYGLLVNPHKYDKNNVETILISVIDNFIKSEPIYFMYIFQLVLRDFKDGCLIISPGSFGSIFKNYISSVNKENKFNVINFNLSFYSSKNQDIKLTDKEINLIINSRKIIFLDDSFSTGKTFLKCQEIITMYNRKFDDGWVYNFTGTRKEGIEKPLKYLFNLMEEVSKQMSTAKGYSDKNREEIPWEDYENK